MPRARPRWSSERATADEIELAGARDALGAGRSASCCAGARRASRRRDRGSGARRRATRPRCATRLGTANASLQHAAGRAAADLPGRRRPGGRGDRRELDRHSRRAHAVRRNPHRAQSATRQWKRASSASRMRSEAVAQAIRTSRAKLTDPRKPIGVFLMVGTSRRRQDRDRADARRAALWRRAESSPSST